MAEKSKKGNKVKPRPEHTLVMQKLLENGGSLGQAMRDAGYSEAYAKNPQHLTNTKSWEQLMDRFLPDHALAEKHAELMNSMRIEHMVFPVNTSKEDITELLLSVKCTPKKFQVGDTAIHVWFWAPDAATQKAAVELAYKIKGYIVKKVDTNLALDAPIALVKFYGRDDGNTIDQPS